MVLYDVRGIECDLSAVSTAAVVLMVVRHAWLSVRSFAAV